MTCLLCGSLRVFLFHEDRQRSYHRCEDCDFIFVPRSSLVSPEEERKHYDTHENSDTDPRYREYLSKITRGMHPFLSPGSAGLDFGCGASTLLAQILEEEGHRVDSFDLYFRPDEKVWEKSFDFIVLSEVIEHLATPLETMKRLQCLLNPGGQFFIKTKFVPAAASAFDNWYYKKDPTHVQFFNDQSVAMLARLLSMKGPEILPSPDLFRLWS